jgi:hypothetical protein
MSRSAPESGTATRVAVLLRGEVPEVPAVQTAHQMAGSDPRQLVVLVPVSRPNLEAEFAAGIRSSALTREIEAEMGRRIDRLMKRADIDLGYHVLPYTPPLLASALRSAVEQACEIVVVPAGRIRPVPRLLLRSRARRKGLRLVLVHSLKDPASSKPLVIETLADADRGD